MPVVMVSRRSFGTCFFLASLMAYVRGPEWSLASESSFLGSSDFGLFWLNRNSCGLASRTVSRVLGARSKVDHPIQVRVIVLVE